MKKTAVGWLKGIPLLDKVGYGTGNFGFGIVFQVIATYLIFYTTAVLRIPGSIIGTAVSLSVIWDGITDPLMGYISDQTKFKRFGRRHLYILVGSIAVAVVNYGLWDINPALPQHLKIAGVLLSVLLIKTFMTVYSVPFTALGAELSTDYDERSSIQGIRTIFFLLGLFTATVMGMYLFFRPTIEFPQGQLNPDAYRNIGIVSSLTALIFGLTCYFSTRKYIPYLPILNEERSKSGFKISRLMGDVVSAFKNLDYKFVVLGYLFTNIASALMGTIGLHVFTYTFLFDNYSIAWVVGIQFGVSILSQPIWVAISKKIDKKPSVMLGLTMSIVGGLYFLVLVFLRDIIQGNFLYFIPFALLAGFGTGGLFSLPLSMIADTIDVEELRTHERNEGIYYGCLTLSYKLSQAIAIFILGILLDIVRFDSSLTYQPKSTVVTLGLILAIGSIISLLFAIFSYKGYSLTKIKIADIQKDIKKIIPSK